MTVFFQHVGEAGGARDFPKTIGTPKNGVRHFDFTELEPFLSHLPAGEVEQLQEDTVAYAPDGFQIWGIPSGAKSVLRDFRSGDYLLLLEAVGPGGTFAYVGRAIAKPSQECFELSRHLWGEQRFPLIVFLKGNLTSYRWFNFALGVLIGPPHRDVARAACAGRDAGYEAYPIRCSNEWYELHLRWRSQLPYVRTRREEIIWNVSICRCANTSRR